MGEKTTDSGWNEQDAGHRQSLHCKQPLHQHQPVRPGRKNRLFRETQSSIFGFDRRRLNPHRRETRWELASSENVAKQTRIRQLTFTEQDLPLPAFFAISQARR